MLRGPKRRFGRVPLGWNTNSKQDAAPVLHARLGLDFWTCRMMISSVLRRSPKSIDDWQVDWPCLRSKTQLLLPWNFANYIPHKFKFVIRGASNQHTICTIIVSHKRPWVLWHEMPVVTGPCGVPLLLSSCHLRFPGSDVPSVGEPPIASKCFRFVPFSCRLVSHDWSSHYSSDAMLKDFVQRHGLELSSRSAARNPTPGSRGCGMPASCLKRI